MDFKFKNAIKNATEAYGLVTIAEEKAKKALEEVKKAIRASVYASREWVNAERKMKEEVKAFSHAASTFSKCPNAGAVATAMEANRRADAVVKAKKKAKAKAMEAKRRADAAMKAYEEAKAKAKEATDTFIRASAFASPFGVSKKHAKTRKTPPCTVCCEKKNNPLGDLLKKAVELRIKLPQGLYGKAQRERYTCYCNTGFWEDSIYVKANRTLRDIVEAVFKKHAEAKTRKQPEKPLQTTGPRAKADGVKTDVKSNPLCNQCNKTETVCVCPSNPLLANLFKAQPSSVLVTQRIAASRGIGGKCERCPTVGKFGHKCSCGGYMTIPVQN